MPEKSPIVKVVKKCAPAVVSIVIAKNLPKLENFPDFFPFLPFNPAELYKQIPPEMFDEHGRVKIGGGSGFIISEDGFVLTNKHVVVDPKADYTIVTNDGVKHHAKVVARDPINDIAILKVEGKNLPYIELGDSTNLELGQTAIAIGNALGQFQNTISSGIISGLSRNISAQAEIGGQKQELRGVIQTDAAINPGNSGGPLVDINGEAIGINSAVVFGAQNIGFAIPVNAAKKALSDIKKYGRIRAPFIGLRYVLIDPVLKMRHNLPVDYGALVVPEATPGDYGVLSNSPAEKAGIEEHDIILEVDNKKVTKDLPLSDIIQSHEIGDKLALKLLRRGGKELETTIVLEEMK
ncbi:MAG: trypsin-like peptidase domain-containing protein [Candidatus Azambacteria bacterium]|nr:trypsin-like peptidase domain-containing protein [Candidatus Azambacteria bacterium]